MITWLISACLFCKNKQMKYEIWNMKYEIWNILLTYGTIYILRKHFFRIFVHRPLPSYVSMFLVMNISKKWHLLTPASPKSAYVIYECSLCSSLCTNSVRVFPKLLFRITQAQKCLFCPFQILRSLEIWACTQFLSSHNFYSAFLVYSWLYF